MRALRSCLALMLAGNAACSKSSAEEDSVATPSFVRVQLHLVGPNADGASEKLSAGTVVIAGCSRGEDNQTVHLEGDIATMANLRVGSTGCTATLTEITFGNSDAVDTFRPESGDGLSGGRGTGLRFVGVESGKGLWVSVDETLHDPLVHSEDLLFSVMPEKGENRLPAHVTLILEEAGEGAIPAVLLTDVSSDGAVATGRTGVSLLVECEEPQSFLHCGDQKLLDLRFAFVARPSEAATLAEALAAVELPDFSIRPLLSYAFRNGFRFSRSVPLDSEGAPVTSAWFVATYRGGARVFEVDLAPFLSP